MEAVRKIIDGDVLSALVDIPSSMRRGQVEILVFPFSPAQPSETVLTKKSSLFPNLALDMTGYFFDRQEANER
ncbi:MAG: hypothetical protein LBR23_05340 [Spirochaetaceae bacterium]|jgi:hypothetical protein|nr:hypothetical protein [Spirochaetaceae bacterium]